MTFKKISTAAILLATMMLYQNCDFGADLSSSEVISKSVKGDKINHFEVNLIEYPHVMPGTQVVSKITATLDYATGINGQIVEFTDKFIIQVKKEDRGVAFCFDTYSLSRDDIRTLLRDIEEMKVNGLSAPTNGPQVIDKAVYNLRVNHRSDEIKLGADNLKVGENFTTSLSFADFKKALDENPSKKISSDVCAAHQPDKPY